jgi:hypothetical protein
MTGASINEPSCFPVPKGLRGARVDAGRQSIVSLTALELERDISIAKAILAWHRVSSATTANSSLSLYQGPLGGVRLNASALSSAVLTLRTLQGIGG